MASFDYKLLQTEAEREAYKTGRANGCLTFIAIMIWPLIALLLALLFHAAPINNLPDTSPDVVIERQEE